MTTIRLNPGAILIFDGMVVEHFYGAESKRVHVGTIHDIQIETDRKGKHWLRINANLELGESLPGGHLFTFSDQVYAQVNGLVPQIQLAVSSFRADNE